MRVVDPHSEMICFESHLTKDKSKNAVLKWAVDFEAKTGRKGITRKEQLEDGGMAINLLSYEGGSLTGLSKTTSSSALFIIFCVEKL